MLRPRMLLARDGSRLRYDWGLLNPNPPMRSGGAGQKRKEGPAVDWRGPDADGMDDAECARYVEGKLTARGSDFQRQPLAGD